MLCITKIHVCHNFDQYVPDQHSEIIYNLLQRIYFSAGGIKMLIKLYTVRL